MYQLLAALIAVALLAVGCNPAGAGPAGPARLDGRAFLSVDVTVNGVQQPLVPGTRVQLTFSDGNLGANAGCNHLGASYRIDGGRLITNTMAMTEMGCDPQRHAQDEWLATFLGSQPTIRPNGPELMLEGSGTVIRLLDREVAQPDRPLVDTRWQLTTIIEAGAASSVPAGIAASLELSTEGTFALDAGCNRGGGHYTLNGSTITFGDVALTRMACDGPRDQVEAAVLAVIGAGPLDYAIDGDGLMLATDDRGLGFSAAPQD